ncbi:MAG: hypothetical protein K2Q20_07570 [Phycisphaerales bacterium]|nr:hypothetical protein [Phycisphaerales bacterium]
MLAFGAALWLSGAAMGDHGEIGVGRNGANQLVGHIDFAQPVRLARSIFPGFPGFASAETGFSNVPLDEPDEDLFTLDPLSSVRAVLVSADAQAVVYDGFPVLQPGQSLELGHPFFDVHPVWTIADAAAVPGVVYTFRFVLRDDAGRSADSEQFSVSFTSACDADYNLSGAATVGDIFDYLSGWFAGGQLADFNRDRTVDVADLFRFLSAWFAGCA